MVSVVLGGYRDSLKSLQQRRCGVVQGAMFADARPQLEKLFGGSAVFDEAPERRNKAGVRFVGEFYCHGSVLRGQHDGEDAERPRLIGWIFGAGGAGSVGVVVDLPEDLFRYVW